MALLVDNDRWSNEEYQLGINQSLLIKKVLATRMYKLHNGPDIVNDILRNINILYNISNLGSFI